jgi:hypothetical protein
MRKLADAEAKLNKNRVGPGREKIRATVARRPGRKCPLKTTATRIIPTQPTQPKPIRAMAAKEVGMGNPAEKTTIRPNQNSKPVSSVPRIRSLIAPQISTLKNQSVASAPK